VERPSHRPCPLGVGGRELVVNAAPLSVNVASVGQHGFTKSARFFASRMFSGLTALGEEMQGAPNGRGAGLEETEGAR
jgi:hypothetical protein